MDDLQKRLQYPSQDVQLAAANKLFTQITNTKELRNLSLPVDEKTRQIPELNLLYDVIQGSISEATSLCCQVVVALVKNGFLDFRFALNKLVNFIPTAQHGSGLVESIADLLTLQASNLQHRRTDVEGSHLIYTMRSPPHPFISVYVSKADLWTNIFQASSRILSSAECSNYWHPTWDMMKPFFMYMLLDPQSAGQSGHMKSSLVSMLISLCKDNTDRRDTILSFLVLDCFPCLQVKTSMALVESLVIIETAASFLLSFRDSHPNHLLKVVAVDLFTVACQLSTSGKGMLSVLTLINKLSSYDVKVLPDTSLLDLSCLLIDTCNPHEQAILLQLLDEVLSVQPNSSLGLDAAILPLLKVVSSRQSPVTIDTKLVKANQKKATQLLSRVSTLDKKDDSTNDIKNDTPKEVAFPLLPGYFTLRHIYQLLGSFKDPSEIASWLNSTKGSLRMYPKNSLQIPAHLLLATSAIFLQSSGPSELCLQVLLEMVEKDHAKASIVLSLLLYKFSQKHLTPALTKQLMFAIPELAHHKYSLSPILKVVQSLASTSALSAIGMRLALRVWIKQERCFPQLQTLLSRTDRGDDGPPGICDEYSVSRVATVRDICVTRPHQHGAELIPTLSKILNECTSPSEAAEAALAMDALKVLSEAEVVDIRTIWMVLAPKLSQDERPKVQESICNLLSVVPELAVETDEFEEFREQVVTLLFQRTQHPNPGVVEAAYSALAEFDREEFYLSDLPEEVAAKVKGQVTMATISQEKTEDEQEEEEEEAEDVPGSCFISLLQMTPQQARIGFQRLLSSLVQQELATIPRHLNFTVLKKESQSSSQLQKFVDVIPPLIYSKYEANKQPGLKPPLAVALLFCYEPKIDKTRGKQGKRYLLSREQLFLNMMRILLNEIRLSCFDNDPFCLLLLPSAWTSFMAKVFQATLDALLAQAATQGQAEVEDELSGLEMTVWLKARDKLCDQLKNVARENTAANPNCLLALAGLAVVSTQHYMNLGADASKLATLVPECISQQRWVSMVVESLLSVLDASYQTGQRLFTWCQRGFRQESKGSNMVAAVGLSQVAPMLIAVDAGIIHKIITRISLSIGSETALSAKGASNKCSMLPGVAMGLLLNKLTGERYVEVVGEEALTRVVTSLDLLEKVAFSKNQHSSGAMLGLGVALSVMAADSSLHVGSQFTTVLDRLRAALRETDISSLNQQVVGLTIAMMTASGFHSNTVTSKDANSILIELMKISEDHTGLRCSIGILGHSLCETAHPSSDTTILPTVREWKETLNSKDSSTEDQVDAINGLVGFISGLGPIFSPIENASFKSEVDQEILQTVRITQQLCLDCQDLRLQSSLITGLGIFSFIKSSSLSQKGAVPTNYDYLPEESLLRACADFLQQGAQQGPGMVPSWQLEVICTALTGDGSNTLPPVNWAILIGPLLRLPYGSHMQYCLVKLALSQCLSSHNASLFLSSWISTASLYDSLEDKTKQLLLISLPVLAQHVPVNKLKAFLFTLILPKVAKGDPLLTLNTLRGLLGALMLKEPPQSVMPVLHDFTEKLYDSLSIENMMNPESMFKLLAECITYLPDKMIDVVSHPAQEGNLVKSTLLRSYLIGCGKQSMAWLNACIDVGMNLSLETDHASLILYLTRGLLQATQSKSKHTSVTSRMQWLVELMGHCHNVASGKTQLREGQTICQATKFLLDLFCCVTGAWCCPQSPILFGIVPFTQLDIPSDTSQWSEDEAGVSSSLSTDEDSIVRGCIDVVAKSLLSLLETQPWSQITTKVLQWLISMHNTPSENIPSVYQDKIKAMCFALRHQTEFKRQIWTTVYGW